MSKYRKLMVLVALIAALTMLASLTGVSFAAGGGTTNDEQETTCIVGYVINHREVAVDGTKFDPQLSVAYLVYPDLAQRRRLLLRPSQPLQRLRRGGYRSDDGH